MCVRTASSAVQMCTDTVRAEVKKTINTFTDIYPGKPNFSLHKEFYGGCSLHGLFNCNEKCIITTSSHSYILLFIVSMSCTTDPSVL